MPFANGENVGAYRIVEKLGQGGMATVFKAYHPALDRYVAVKVMHPAFAQDPNFAARFQREARIVAKLDHPHIIPIYDYSSHRGYPYLVMRFVAGETLKARMERGPLDVPEVLRIARAVGQALTYAHEQGILHRDVKPSNIILTPDGGVYLTDFGLARMAEAGESTLSRDALLGTPQYVSPEQAKGAKDLDARTDVYSFGVVLYELLVGRPPFVADTPYAVIHDHIFTPLPLPGDLNPNLPEAAQRMLLKALAKEPDDRFQSVDELIQALDAAFESVPTLPPPPAVPVSQETIVVSTPQEEQVQPQEKREPEKKRRWPWVVAGAAALVALGVIILLGLRATRQRRHAQVTPPAATAQVQAPPAEGDAGQLVEEAKAAAEANNLGSALDLYEQAMDVDPHLVTAYVGASRTLVEMGDAGRALEVLQRGVEANPEDRELHKHLATLLLLTEQFDGAEEELRWLEQDSPDDPLVHAYAGVLALAQGQPCDKARPELDDALRLDPDLAWAHYGMALCDLQARNVDEARAELELVLAQPDTPPFLRARAEQKLNMLDKGTRGAVKREFVALVDRANEIPDEDLRHSLQDMLGAAQGAWENGESEQAIQILQQAQQWVQDNSDVLGAPLTGDLLERLTRIIDMAQATAGP